MLPLLCFVSTVASDLCHFAVRSKIAKRFFSGSQKQFVLLVGVLSLGHSLPSYWKNLP